MTNRAGLRNSALGVAAVAVALVLGGCRGDAPTAPRTTTVTVTPTARPSSSTSTTTTSTTSTAPTDQPPTTFDQAMQHLAAGRVDPGAKPVFTSPTGNIFCSVAAANAVPAGCEVRDGRVAPPPGTCPAGGGGAQDVGRIEWSGDTPKPICNSDSMYQPGAQVLQYGAIATANGSPIQCVSEMIGMTCVDSTSKKGFFLAKGVYKIF